MRMKKEFRIQHQQKHPPLLNIAIYVSIRYRLALWERAVRVCVRHTLILQFHYRACISSCKRCMTPLIPFSPGISKKWKKHKGFFSSNQVVLNISLSLSLTQTQTMSAHVQAKFFHSSCALCTVQFLGRALVRMPVNPLLPHKWICTHLHHTKHIRI